MAQILHPSLTSPKESPNALSSKFSEVWIINNLDMVVVPKSLTRDQLSGCRIISSQLCDILWSYSLHIGFIKFSKDLYSYTKDIFRMLYCMKTHENSLEMLEIKKLHQINSILYTDRQAFTLTKIYMLLPLFMPLRTCTCHPL